MSARLKIELEATPAMANGSPAGHGWRVIFGGQEVGSGWCAGSKREARKEARSAAEQMGLISDGVDGNV